MNCDKVIQNRRSEEPGTQTAAGPWPITVRLAFVAVLALCIAWVATHALLVDSVTVRLCAQADAGIPPAQRLPVFLSEIAFDGYVWNRHAEHLGEDGGWRLRHTDFDNAPEGREVHWNSAFAWYLRGLGEARRRLTGDALRNSIFRMSIWANPILLILALILLATRVARRFGPLCGAVIAIGMIVVPTFYEGFQPAYPDHHGIIALALLGAMCGVAFAGAGWVQAPAGADFALPRSLRQARLGMIFSALSGAAGLWFSALSTSLVLGAIGIAAVVSPLVFARAATGRTEDADFHPELWRTWASWGAGGSLFFYLLEYFPSHLGLRLEVNHPFYALAWLGGGWIVARIGEWASQPSRSLKSFPWRETAWPAAALSSLPALILLGPPEIYLPKDPFIWRLHQNIVEFLPVLKRIAIGSMSWQGFFLWLQVVPLAAILLLCVRRLGKGARASLLTLLLPVLLLTALQFYQSRWGLILGPLYIALAGLAVPRYWRLAAPHRLLRIFAAVLLLAFTTLLAAPVFKACIAQPTSNWRRGVGAAMSPGQGLALLHRQMAYAIRESAGGTPVVLLSSPNSSCLLAALGGFRTVGTLYWENVAGLKAAAAALNAQSEAEAQAFMQRHRITHVAFMNWENFIEPFFRVLHPAPAPGVSFENAFGRRALFDKVIPPWMRPVVFPPNALTRGLDQRVLLLQYAPDQSLDEARLHVARFVRQVEGEPAAARNVLRELLAEAPTNLQARAELAGVEFELRDFDQGVEAVTALIRDVDQQQRENLTAQTIVLLFREAQWRHLALFLRQLAEHPDASPALLRQAAWFLATLPDSRDAALALACCDRLEAFGQDDGFVPLARAAGHAAAGDFRQAVRLTVQLEGDADVAPERRKQAATMRASFAAGRPWIEPVPDVSPPSSPP